MFKFSEMTPWQNDSAVQQVLVFPCEEVKALFDIAFKKEVEEKGIEGADCKNKGAIYMLRAVRDIKGKYIPIIRCGFTGALLWESQDRLEKSEHAIWYCANKLNYDIDWSIKNEWARDGVRIKKD